MIDEILGQHQWLWPLAWQSTVVLALGLGGSLLLRKRAARAHRFLLLALVAAVVVPMLSQLVKRCHWGLLQEKPPAIVEVQPPGEAEVEAKPVVAYETSEIEPTVTYVPETKKAEIPAATPLPEPEIQPARNIAWQRFILPAWGILSVVWLIRLAISFALGIRLVTRSQPCEAEQIIDAIERARKRLSIETTVRLRRSPHTHNPVIWCWGTSPTLLVPEQTKDSSTVDWRSVVCHELAHWKRRDHLTALWAELVACALPWNPLAFWAKRRLVRLSEDACDDWTIASGQTPTTYARTLLGLTAQKQTALVPSIVTNKKSLATRVRRILTDQCGNPRTGRRWTLAAIALATCLAVTIALAQTRPASSEEEPPDAEKQLEPKDESAPDNSQDANLVRLRLLDPEGQPVQDARATNRIGFRGYDVMGSRLEWHLAPVSDETGLLRVGAFMDQGAPTPDWPLYILHERRQLGAVLQWDRSEAEKTTEVSLAPVCKVRGSVVSSALKSIDMPLDYSRIYVTWCDGRILDQSLTRNEAFELMLPPGRYELVAQGSGRAGTWTQPYASAKQRVIPLEIQPGRKELDLGRIELRLSEPAMLIGKPAPPLGPIEAWRNGGPVSLADLRGQLVCLYFGEDTPNTHQHLSELVKLHETFGDKGLTIIALFGCTSFQELDRNWDQSCQRHGGPREVPFRVAIDGGRTPSSEEANAPDLGVTFRRYGISPARSILIDKDGNVMGELNPSSAERTVRTILEPPPDDSDQRQLQAKFDSVYHLEDDEVIKRIAPPFVPEREKRYFDLEKRMAELKRPVPPSLLFHWSFGELDGSGGTSRESATLRKLLIHLVGLKSFEYDGPKHLLDLKLPGDWIVRSGAPQDAILKALETLLQDEFGRTIKFEQRQVSRDVIVVRGKYKFQPLRYPSLLRGNQTASRYVHVYAVEGEPDSHTHGTVGVSASHLLECIGNYIALPVVDRTEPFQVWGQGVECHQSAHAIRSTKDPQERKRLLDQLFANLTAQTGLTFAIEKQPTELWVVTEEMK